MKYEVVAEYTFTFESEAETLKEVVDLIEEGLPAIEIQGTSNVCVSLDVSPA